MSQDDKPSKKPAQSDNTEAKRRTFIQRLFMREGMKDALLLPLLSVFTALVIGAVLLTLSSAQVLEAWVNFGSNPGRALSLPFTTVFNAYAALFQGAFGNPVQIISAFGTLFSSGQTRPLLDAFRPLTQEPLQDTYQILPLVPAGVNPVISKCI